MALGGTLMTIALQRHSAKVIEAIRCSEQSDAPFGAVIASPPEVHGKVLMCDLKVLEGVKNPLLVRASIMKNERSERLMVGDGIRFSGEWEPLLPDEEPLERGQLARKKSTDGQAGIFNYRQHLRRHGYAATCFVSDDAWMGVALRLTSLSLAERTRLALSGVREQLVERLGKMGLADEQLAIVAAMTLGDKTMLDKRTKDIFSTTGASHVLALSGLHLGIIYSLLLILSFRKRLTPVFSCVLLLMIWGYVIMVGMSPSVVRAALMLTLYTLIQLIGREKTSINALAFAAFVMLIVSPMAVYDVGFQLSFASVGAILLCYRPLYGVLSDRCNVKRWKVADKLWQLTCVSIAAQIGVAPLIALYFHRLPVYFLLTNFIVIPVATVLIMLTLAFFVCWWWAGAQWLLGKGIAFLAVFMNNTLTAISEWPGASIGPLHITSLQVVLLYVAMICIYILLTWRRDGRLVKTDE